MYDQRATQLVRAPRSAVYAALLDPVAVERWRVPDDMTSRIHAWEPHEGGRFRVSLTYRSEDRTGKTEDATDTYAGRFTRLVPDELVIEELAFETGDPALRGTMTMTWTLRERSVDSGDGAEGAEGTEVDLLHEGLPDVVRPEDNEVGTRVSLTKLAAYVEAAG